MNNFRLEQVPAIRAQLEKIEMKAIATMRLLREPQVKADLFGKSAETIMNIQRRIRHFREMLGGSAEDFSYQEFVDFKQYAQSTLHYLTKAALEPHSHQ